MIWNGTRAGSRRFRSQSPQYSNSYISFGYRSLDQCRIQACLHLCIYLYYLNSFMCVVSRLDVCGGPSTLLTAKSAACLSYLLYYIIFLYFYRRHVCVRHFFLYWYARIDLVPWLGGLSTMVIAIQSWVGHDAHSPTMRILIVRLWASCT